MCNIPKCDGRVVEARRTCVYVMCCSHERCRRPVKTVSAIRPIRVDHYRYTNSYVKLHVDVTSCNRIRNSTNYWLFYLRNCAQASTKSAVRSPSYKLLTRASYIRRIEIKNLTNSLCKSHRDNTT